MTDQLLLWVSDYGVIVIFAATVLSCFGLPSPASLMMMAGGAFVASDDLVLWQVCGAAFAGAMLGDQSSYWLARKGGGQRLWAWLTRKRGAGRLMRQAEAFLDRRGGWAVFLTRWLFSPLAPYVNLSAGATAMAWPRYTLANATGEVIWVALYVSLGYAFTTQIEEISDTLGNLIWALSAGVVTLALAVIWWRSGRNSDQGSR